MEIIDIFTSKEIKIIKEAGINVTENANYSKDDFKIWASEMEEYILSHSSKGKLISNLNNEYATIFSKITRIIDRK